MFSELSLHKGKNTHKVATEWLVPAPVQNLNKQLQSTKLLKFKSIAYIQNDTYSVATVLSSVYITYTCIHIYIHSMCIYVYVYVYVHYILYRKHCTMITYTYLLQVLPRPTLFLRRVNLVELASGETGQRPRRSMFTPEIQPLVA